MEKTIKNYKTNLIIMIICYILIIIFNLHLFNSGDFLKLLYGLLVLILGTLTIYSFVLINKNIKTSAKIATIIGPIMSLLSFIEGFMYGNGFIINFRVAVLFIMIGGILIFNAGRKISKNNI